METVKGWRPRFSTVHFRIIVLGLCYLMGSSFGTPIFEARVQCSPGPPKEGRDGL